MTPRSGFDRVARAYRWLEYLSFGRALERCRLARLPQMQQARHALVLGDGDGRFTALLMATNPHIRVVAVDSSAAMLRLLSARVHSQGASHRLTTIHAEAVRLLEQPYGPLHRDGAMHRDSTRPPFDLVATHFFLDCLTNAELRRLVQAVRPRLAPGSLWIVSEFATPSAWSRLVVALLYRGFALLAGLKTQRLPAYAETLHTQGFVRLDQLFWLRGLVTSTIWTPEPG